MPFNHRRHASQQIQQTVGLFVANCEAPRIGDRTREGAHGHNIISCTAHQQALTEAHALLLFNMIPNAIKDNPNNGEAAKAISLLAQNARQATPQGCQPAIGNGEAQPGPLTYYMAPGSPLFTGKTHGSKFIAFLHENMDLNHRVRWYDLTGREQYEWYSCWNNLGRPYRRIANETRGLRGTDLADLTDVASVTVAMARSPSLSRRRPVAHAVPNAAWDDVARALFP